MAADMDVRSFIRFIIHRLRAALFGFGRKYFFQCAGPCLKGLIHADLHICIFEAVTVCHFADHRVGDLQAAHLSVCNFRDDITECRCEEISRIHVVLQLHAHLIAECHAADRSDHAVAVRYVSGHDASGTDVFREFCILFHDLIVLRKVILISFDTEPYKLIAGFFQFRRNDLIVMGHIHGKGYQGRRHVDILERSGHTVLSADGRQAVADLCGVGAEQGRERLAPALRIFGHPAEIFLECEPDAVEISACSHDLGNGFCYGIHRAVIRAPA